MNPPHASRHPGKSRSASGTAVALAVTLLDQAWPESPALADVMRTAGSTALQNDPRYLIGRFTQALAALLASDLPPMDASTALLSDALADAIAWRQHRDRTSCPRCSESLCGQCTADWDQADRYHLLALTLGAVGNIPAQAPTR